MAPACSRNTKNPQNMAPMMKATVKFPVSNDATIATANNAEPISQ